MNKEMHPLTSYQKGIYEDQLIQGDVPVYVIGGYVRMEGRLSEPVFIEAIQELIQRHDALRTRIGEKNGVPYQYFDDHPECQIPLIDFSKENKPEEKCVDWMQSRIHQNIFLYDNPLHEFALLKSNENEYYYFVKYHHLINDGWGVLLCIQDLAEIYNRLLSGRKERAYELYSYASFVEANQAYLKSEKNHADREYWTGKFSELPEQLIYGHRNRNGTKCNVDTLPIGANTHAQIQESMKSDYLTDFHYYLGILFIYFSRIFNKDEIVIGIPLMNRNTESFDRTAGLFANLVPLRMRIDPDRTFLEFLVEIKRELYRLYRHSSLSFAEINRLLVNQKHPADRYSLMDIVFSYEVNHGDIAFEGVDTFELNALHHGHSRNPITLFLKDYHRGGSVSLELHHQEFVFNRHMPSENILNHLNVLIAECHRNPDRMIKNTHFLSETDMAVMTQANATEMEYPQDETLMSLFEKSALKYPDHPALLFENSSMTYSELNGKANRIGGLLRSHGVGPDDLVAIICERSFELLIGIYGILKAGGAYLPIDPSAPDERIRYILKDSGVRIILAQPEFANRISFSGEVISLDEEANYPGDGRNLQEITGPENLAYCIYTSGSTGWPKGVLIEHRSVINLLDALQKNFPLREGESFLLRTLHTFDASIHELFGWFMDGASLAILSPGAEKEPGLILDSLELHRVTHVKFAPSLLQIFTGMAEKERFEKLTALKYVFVGGEALHPNLATQFYEKIPADIRLENVYGPTECTVDSTFFHVDRTSRSIPIGRPLQNVQVYVLHGDRLQPIGAPGELCISGTGLARGYLNRPELTAEKFVENPFFPGTRMYRSGDLARWLPDGNIEYLGRIDDQVKISGFRIEPGEIESRLREHPGIREVAVIVHEADGEKQLVACYVPDDEKPAVGTLREFLKERLPDYMVPAYFTELAEMPLTSNGKVDRRALSTLKPNESKLEAYVAPHSELQWELSRIWQDVLKADRVGVTDNFFEMGGDSLRAMHLVSRIQSETGLELTVRDLFEYPRIREITDHFSGAQRTDHAPVEKAEEREFYRTSSAQKRMYILSQTTGETKNYNMPGMFDMMGDVDFTRLEDAARKLIERHESLRTSFHMIDGEVVQKIHDRVLFYIEHCESSEDEANALLANFIRPFDLSEAPLFRMMVVKTGKNGHILCFDMHHIVSDGVSIGVMIRDFVDLYKGEELAPARLQYRDFSEWQNRLFETEAFRKQEGYWLDRFGGELPVLNLPLDHVRPLVQSFDGDRVSLQIGDELYGGLQALKRETGSTLYMIFLAAFNVLLSRYSGQNDIVVGSPMAGRPHADLQNITGMFVNTIVLRNHPEGGKSFREFLSEIKQSTLEALENQEYPFEELVEKISMTRDMSRNPLFDVMFTFENFRKPEFRLGKTRVLQRQFEYQIAKLDLTLTARQGDAGIELQLEYNTSLFERSTAERMIAHCVQILNGVALDASTKLSEIDILTEADKALIDQANATATEFPENETLMSLFEKSAIKYPDYPALLFENSSLTYAELNQKANQLGRLLRSKGIGPDDLVGIMCERSFEMVIGIYGVLKSGGAYLPIDPSASRERIRYMLEDSGAKLVLTQGKFADTFSFMSEVILLDEERNYLEDDKNPEHTGGSKSLAYCIYTSGSTGLPKGVLIEHGSAVNMLDAVQKNFPVSSRDVFLSKISYTFDPSVWELFGWFHEGGSLALLAPRAEKDVTLTLEAMDRHRATHAIFVPSMLQVMLDTMVPEDLQKLSGLKYLFVGGEVFSPNLARKIRESTGAGIKTVNLYGPTEGTIVTTAHTIQETDGAIPVGKPLQNIQVHVTGSDGEPQPVGVPGELCISGVCLARGYLNRPELTAEKFVENPFSPGMRMYRSGDLARWLPNGSIEYLGRVDDQVKIRGFRIEPGEIEKRLEEHELVRDVSVVVREDVPGEKQIAAYYVPGNEKPTVAELRLFLKERLPDYMVPSYFVEIEEMPLTSNGKADRRALLMLKPERNEVKAYVAPRNEADALIAGIWEEVLKVNRVGITDNFFERGGDSLRAIQVVSRIQSELRAECSIRDIFDSPTVMGISDRISGANRTIYESIQKAEEKEYYQASSAQKRMYILSQISEATRNYHIPGMFDLVGNLDIARLNRACRRLIERHESFRTSFHMIDGEVVQKIHADVHFDLDYRESTEEDVVGLSGEFVRPFDLSVAPLFRMMVVNTGEEKHVLCIDMHHIVSDGVSMGILIRDFIRLYEDEELLPVRLQYKDFSEWQNRIFTTGEFKKQEDYWNGRFSGTLPVLNLPLDHPRPPVQNFHGDRVESRIDGEIYEGLKRLARETGSTLYMILLAAFNVLLSRYSGQSEVVIGSPIAGRPHADLQNITGMFVNTIVLLNTLNEEKSFLEFLGEVKRNTLEAMEHQDYPFEELVERLAPVRGMSRNPLFDVMFTLENFDQPEFSLGGMRAVPREFEYKIAKFDLSLIARQSDTNIEFQLGYATALFERRSAERMLRCYLRILEEVLSKTSKQLNEINILPDEEHHRVLYEFNDTAVTLPSGITCLDHFESQVRLNPQRACVIGEKGTLTFRELNDKANQLARFLIKKGVKKNQVVGVMIDRSHLIPLGILGILKANCPYVPLDADYPEERILYMLTQCNTDTLVTVSSLLPGLIALKTLSAKIRRVIVLDAVTELEMGNEQGILIYDVRDLEKESEESLSEKPLTGDPAYVIFTSGTTGNPKGVLNTHGSILNLTEYLNRNYYTSGDRVAQLAPATFDPSVMDIFVSITSGSTLFMMPPVLEILPEDIVKFLIRNEITHLMITQSILKQVYSAGAEERRSELKNLKYLIVGGEPLETGVAAQFHDYFSPETCLINIYGPTETTVFSTLYRVGENLDPVPPVVTIGKPIDNTRIYILDNAKNLCPIGVAGEICIAGHGVSTGYLNNQELTDEKFVKSRFAENETYYRTGDQGRWLPDGNIEIRGRIDLQVKIRGYRIEPGEIEKRLEEHELVQEVSVIVREDVPGEKQLAAYYVPREEKPTLGELRLFLKERLPEYMVPTYFVELAEMPLASNGKVDRRAMLAFKPDLALENEYVAPHNEAEELLAGIWKDVLKVDRVGITDNFFEIGGDSIKAISVSARLLKIGYRLEVNQLFRHPTVEELSGIVEVNDDISIDEDTSGIAPLTPIQKWFFESVRTDRDHFNQSIVIHTKEHFNEAYIQESFSFLVSHHEALRFRFPSRDGITTQECGDKNSGSYKFDSLKSDEDSDAIRALYVSEIQKKLNIEDGPLVSIGLLNMPAGDYLIIAMHHLIIDTVSWGILLDDFQTCYRQLATNKKITPPPKTISFQKWAHSLTQYSKEPALLDQANYWLKKTKTRCDDLRPDRVISEKDRVLRNYRIYTLQLNEKITQGLQREAGSMKINLLSALSYSIKKKFGADLFLINLEGHGREAIREKINVERTVGWFTSLYPILSNMKECNTIEDAAIRIRHELNSIPHNGIGYGILRYLSRKNGMVELTATPQIVFNYLGSTIADEETGYQIMNVPAHDLFSPDYKLNHVFDINAGIENNRIKISISYNKLEYHEKSIENFAECFRENLEILSEKHIQKIQNENPSLAGESIPELERELAEYRSRYKKEDFIPLKSAKIFENILITGATGYLGAHLVYEFLTQSDAKIHLLVRGKTLMDAGCRLEDKMAYYFSKDFYEKYRHRMKVVCGDLAKERFDLELDQFRELEEKIDLILHSAANVKQYGNYDVFFSVNVEGTRRLLELASTGKEKEFHYISTGSVVEGDVPGREYLLFSEYCHDVGQQVQKSPYVYSKLEAEKLVLAFREKNINCCIHRAGNLVFHSETGKFQHNINDDFFYAIFKAMIVLKFVPDVAGFIDWSYIDRAAKAIFLLVSRSDKKNETYHIQNSYPCSWNEMSQILNKLNIEHALLPPGKLNEYLISFIDDPNLHKVAEKFLLHAGILDHFEANTRKLFTSERTSFMLSRLGFEWPQISVELVEKMIRHCYNRGFLSDNSFYRSSSTTGRRQVYGESPGNC